MFVPCVLPIAVPILAHLPGLRLALLGLGYHPDPVSYLLRAAGALGRWIDKHHLGRDALPSWQIEAFLKSRREAGCRTCLTRRGLDPILRYLQSVGAVSVTDDPPPAPSDIETIVLSFQCYLRSERGLASTSVPRYVEIVRRFLQTEFPKEVDLGRIDPDGLASYVRGQAERFQKKTVGLACTALRALLRFLYLRGDLSVDLGVAIPPPVSWRLARLPKPVPMAEVRQLLRGCDRRTRSGRGEYALLLLLIRLGLRASEVAALNLDDISWHHAELVVRGKGSRVDRLPLPCDVGEAIVAYLRRGRPRTASRALFVHNRAPYQRLQSSAVGSRTQRAFVRAGLPPAGPHCLRHTAATEMLRRGASLEDIAQVLRHHSIDTTAIYAKLDRRILSELAQLWRGATP